MGINEEAAPTTVSMGDPLSWPEFRAKVIELLDEEGRKLQEGVDSLPYKHRTWWGYPATSRPEFPMGPLLCVAGPLTLRKELTLEVEKPSVTALPEGVSRHKYLDGEELRGIEIDAKGQDV